MTSLYKKIPESATDSGIFYVKPYKSYRLCLLRDHDVHRVRRIITGSDAVLENARPFLRIEVFYGQAVNRAVPVGKNFFCPVLAYENSRAEAYFKLADLVRLGRVSLPDDDVLREELAFCRYDVESSPLKLVPKKKLPRSPNRSDALAMLFWELDYAKLTAKPEDTSDLTSPTRRRREREEYAGSTWEE